MARPTIRPPRLTYLHGPARGDQSSKIAMAGAVVDLGESLAFASAAGLERGGRGAAERRLLVRGAVRYIKDLGMVLEVGDGQEEEAGVHLGPALYRQMFSAMAANRDRGVYLQGLIIVVKRLNNIHKGSRRQGRPRRRGRKCRPWRRQLWRNGTVLLDGMVL